MQQFKRVAAMLLCLVMLFSCLPMGVFAADAPIAVVVAASDFQQNANTQAEGHRKSDSVMEGIIAAMVAGGVTKADGAIFCGDYSNQYTATESNTGLGYVYDNYNTTWGLDYEDIVFIQGNHDPASTGNLDKSGANDPKSGAYGVFVIHEDDYAWASGDYGKTESEIKATAANLKSYLDQKVADKFDAPIFVASHLPLHYSMRTYNDGDCRYAKYLFDVLNEGAANGLNIIYLYGHNHSQSFENYHGGGAVFYSKGDEILIGDTASQKTHHTETIQFTYMNAGYTGRFDAEDTADPTNTGSVFQIYEDKVVITRYDANGVHNLKSEGVQSKKYSTEAKLYAPNTRVETSPQTVELQSFAAEEPEVKEPVLVEKDGVGIEAVGITDVTVTREQKTVAGYSAYVSYDITPAGYTQGTTATVTLAIDTTIFDVSRPVIVIDQQKGQLGETDIVDGKITFTTDHFSVYDVAQVEETADSGSDLTWKEIPGEYKTIFRLANSLTSGKKYLIVNTDQAGSAKAVNLNSTSINSITVNVTADSKGNYIDAPAAAAQWTYTSSRFQNVSSTGRYLRGSSTNLASTTNTGSSYITWSYSDGLRVRQNASSGSYRYLHSGFTTNTTSSTTDRVYVYVEEQLATESIWVAFTGETLYNLDKGEYADSDAVLDMIRGNIHVYTATSASGAGQQEITDYTLTGTVRPAVPGKYTLTVSYGNTRLATITVNVAGNNYPEYPNEGAVKVNKTGTGIDFQSSGIAQVEISASGIPQNKGADVIIMLDTSSSMGENTADGKQTRLAALKTSLKQLIQQLQQKREDGSDPDIRVAVTDFNGYNRTSDPNSAYHRNESADKIGSSVTGTAGIKAQIFTNVNGSSQAPKDATAATLNATAFQDINTISMGSDYPFDNEIDMHSGTNYDYAFDAIYQLGEAIQAQNAEEGVERDLYVVFMSDGGPFQYNYFSGSSSGYTTAAGNWNDWLKGTYASAANVPGSSTHKYYYNGVGNSHRMADAIKGNPAEMYDVIRKDADPSTFVDVTGDGKADDYMVQVPGLGATMYSIGFCIIDDNDLTKETINYVLEGVSSDPEKYYYSVDNGDSLEAAFAAIGSDIAYAAYNARYVDQMGKDYNLQLKTSTYEVVENGAKKEKTLAPVIEVLTYDIYTKADEIAGTIPAGKHVGDRKGTSTVLETVRFSADGKEAYSDKKSGNILVGGVICAQNFWYNTNLTAVEIEGISIPTGKDSADLTTGSTNMLPAETFYWKMGTVQTSELAMRYYVYLDGSMEGTREAGSYPTNEYATLYYDNYLHNPCYKETVSPVLPWKEANVSYAFYLVNEKGEIIVNQTTGLTGTFANKIAVTNPVVYDTVLLNTNEEIDAVEAAKVLPDGYTLFDATYDANGNIIDGATYTVTVNSNTTGAWEITSEKDVATTYVMHYDPADASAYSKDLNNSTIGNDYTHTVVWFAVVWKVQALPDVVVIDYGLPVDISVLANDMFGENGKLAGVGAAAKLPADYDTAVTGESAMAAGFGTDYTGTYGAAKIDAATGKVRYTPANMQMNGYEKFAYAVNYTGNEKAGFYYDTVTVIPATTIYYEDSFLDLGSYTWSEAENGWVEKSTSLWSQVGTVNGDAVQDEDRPGRYSLTDANNIYGYDSVNRNMSMYSLGSALKATVDYDNYASASFQFYGTGFDVVSMTSGDTGTLVVNVMQNGQLLEGKSFAVDTYYGYKQEFYKVTYTYTDGAWAVTGKVQLDAEPAADTYVDAPENPAEGDTYTTSLAKWVVDPTATDSIYQVPVIKVEDLPYGLYEVEIQALYEPIFDHREGSTSYDLYLDAIRIYDPANDGASDGTTDTTIEDAYKADGEGWPSYIELRNKIIEANSFDDVANDKLTQDIDGLVFIDGDASVGNAQIDDYKNYGPNNEVYLAPGQRVAFLLGTPANIANVHIGIKSADGNDCTYSIQNIAQTNNLETGVDAGAVYNEKTYTVDTATDMYYDLTGWKNDIIVISNTGSEGILSLTNIKSTYTSAPTGGAAAASETQTYAVMAASESAETYVYMTPAAATLTLRSLNRPAQEEIPEQTEPETTVPEETEPETTVPEETEPETTVPEETEPETTVPEETEPETTRPGSGASSSIGGIIVGIIKKLLGWLFG